MAMKARLDGGRMAPTSLTVQSKMWATPTATDGIRGTDAARPGRTGGDSLKQAVAQLGHPGETTPTDGTNGPPEADLNPSFVESLMGLPDGWSDPLGSVSGFTRRATDWSRRLGRTPSGN